MGSTTLDLSGLSDRDLDRLHRDAAIAADDGVGVRELFDALRDAAAAERRRRSGRGPRPGGLPETFAADPTTIVEDQRNAMSRAIRRRDDERTSDALRSVWAGVVERLAGMRREAKAAIRDDLVAGGPPTSGGMLDALLDEPDADAGPAIARVPSGRTGRRAEDAIPSHVAVDDAGLPAGTRATVRRSTAGADPQPLVAGTGLAGATGTPNRSTEPIELAAEAPEPGRPEPRPGRRLEPELDLDRAGR